MPLEVFILEGQQLLLEEVRGVGGVRRVCSGAYHVETSIFITRITRVAHSHTTGLLRSNYILVGNGTTSGGIGLRTNSDIAIGVPSPIICSIATRRVPLSVVCRSSSLLIMGGPGNVIIRPTTKGCSNALIGTLVRRYNTSLSNVGNIVQPKVIRQVSGGADKLLVITGGSTTRRKLTLRVGSRSFIHRCRTIICNGLGGSDNVVSTPVNERPVGHGVVTIASGGDGGTIARCAILRHFNGFARMELGLRANEARRVHIRVTCVNRPITNSRICNPGGIVGSLSNRYLRTGGLKFVRPVGSACVRFRSSLPSCFIGFLGRVG